MKQSITCYEEFIKSAQENKYVTTDKKTPFNTSLHYSNPTARQERTVFGRSEKDLFYNYDDRLISEKWFIGLEKAKTQAEPNTAEFYEIALNHFHDAEDVNLKHVILGCNMSNGFSYLIFGYTYSRDSAQTKLVLTIN